MTKRLLSCMLTLLFLFTALMPVLTAQATVLPGYTSKVDYDNTDPNRYKIEIDLNNQIITVYERSWGGQYDNIVVRGLCTTGGVETPTGAGTYKLGDLKERFGYFVAYGQYAQYWTQVVRGIYIHSVMYNSKKLSSMSSSAYRNLGKAGSHGCVRVLPEIAQFIFYNCPPGTTCVVTKGIPSNPRLVQALKKAMPSKSKYKQPTDAKADPAILPATIKMNNVPVRTGFSSSRDTTVCTLNYGDHVKILQLGADWVKVETAKGKLGYVKTQYVLVEPDNPVRYITEYAASSKTYLYEKTKTSAKRLATIPKKAKVEVTGQVDKYWYTATVDGKTGYVRAKYVKPQQVWQYPQVPNLSGTTTGTGNARVLPNIIANFRSGPSTSYSVVAELQPNTPVTLISQQGNWYYAKANGVNGYISAICVQMGS